MIAGFKEFIQRGNAVDLAVGVVIGAAFGQIVTVLVDNVIDPLVAGLFGKPEFDRLWVWTVVPAQGDTPATEVLVFSVLTAFINFLIVAAAVYVLVVVPMNKLAERRQAEEEPEEPAEDVVVLTEIRDLLATQAGARGMSGRDGGGPETI